MRLGVILLIMSFWSVSAEAARATLSWQAPEQYNDGSPIDEELFYRLYYSHASSTDVVVLEVGTATSAGIDGFEPGEPYRFAVSAYTATADESELSAPVEWTAPVAEEVDITPPIVQIASPDEGDRVKRNETIIIQVAATDDVGVREVTIFVLHQGSIIHSCADRVSAYTCRWRVPNQRNRTYVIQAKANDAAGNERQATPVQVHVRS